MAEREGWRNGQVELVGPDGAIRINRIEPVQWPELEPDWHEPRPMHRLDDEAVPEPAENLVDEEEREAARLHQIVLQRQEYMQVLRDMEERDLDRFRREILENGN